jgi:hypothetical protein
MAFLAKDYFGSRIDEGEQHHRLQPAESKVNPPHNGRRARAFASSTGRGGSAEGPARLGNRADDHLPLHPGSRS